MTVIVKFLSLLLYSIFQIDKEKNKQTNKTKPKKKIEIKHDKMISLTFCFLFVFCFACIRPVSCVGNVDSVSVVSILGCPFGFL